MIVLTFHSTFFALSAEKAVRKAGFDGKLIPVPRQISTSCGTALRLREGNLEEILELLKEAGVEIDEVHKLPDSR